MSKQHVGSSLRSLFEELGEDAELDLLTRKKVLADQVAAGMDRMKLTKEALAVAMHTSRTVVYRLLDPTDTGVTLETLSKASRALELDLHISFGPRAGAGGGGRKGSARTKRARAKATRSAARSPAR